MGAQASGDKNHPKEVYLGDNEFRNTAQMLEAQGVKVYLEDKIKAFPDPEQGLGSIITIQRATVVTIRDGSTAKSYRTWSETVEGLLKEKMIDIGNKDIVAPDLRGKIAMNSEVIITRVSESEIKEMVNLPFKTITREDPALEKGKQKIETSGVVGSKERIYRVRRENGDLISRELIRERVVKDVVNQVVIKGTKPPLNLISRGQYRDAINAAAQKYGISAGALYCLMMAESNGHYNSVNPSGPYIGLFQYHQGTWNKFSKQAGYGGASIYDPVAQINVTAWVLKNVGGGSWGPWPSCRNK